MKIVHIISGLGVGGAETTLLNLVKCTQNKEVSHTIISLSAVVPLAPDFQHAGANVRILGMRGALLPIAFARLVKWIVEERPDVVQTWMYHADLMGGAATKLVRFGKRITRAGHGPKLLWGIHRSEVPTSHGIATRLTARLCSLLSNHIPDQIVCCAEAARLSHAQFGYDSTRMLVIHNGFDTARFSPDSKARRHLLDAITVPDNSVLIGLVGRFNPAKDFDNFLNAATAVAKHIPNARFVLVGKDVDHANTPLCASIAKLGLTEKITLLGSRTDVAHLMAGFDLLCLSSRTEGFPTVVGEAMAAGVPCVATDVGDTKLLVGNTGLIVPPRDPAALASALERFATLSPEQRREYSSEARLRIIENFSIESCWRQYYRIYALQK